jgi:CBS domain containing-hemolysin-like protein
MTAMIIGICLSLVGMGVVLASLATYISRCCKIKFDILNIVFSILSIILALLVGSTFPKTLARYNTEKIGIVMLPEVIKFAASFKVVIRFLLDISNRVIKFFNVQHIESLYIKAAEIDFLLSNENTLPLPDDLRKLVSNIMGFAERKMSQVMAPLSETFAVDMYLPKEKNN